VSRVFGGDGELTKLRPSRMAKRQLQLRDEEVEHVAEMIRGWMLDGASMGSGDEDGSPGSVSWQ
jgi:hypothetical protein